jgi:glycosyltransferase involved in cell wall biosynthesis
MLEAFYVSKLYARISIIPYGRWSRLKQDSRLIKGFQLDGYVTILPLIYPFDIVQNARFTVLTSHYEGFPMSMVESLALTPVVVDCNSGPREIVIDEYNGLLVENYNVKSSQLPLTV